MRSATRGPSGDGRKGGSGMTKLQFRPATRKQLKVKIGLMGTAGTGKTWNALAIAEALGGSVYVIDSERGRAEAYAGDFEFKHLALPTYSPETYVEALSLANSEGADIVIVDSISHEWMGRDGILSSVDRFGGWKEATPRHDTFVESLFRLPRNVICTIRAKTQYQVAEVERDGRKKQEITKLGVGPVQRDNLEYEFDLLGMVELDHSIRLHKSVISSLPSGALLSPGDNPRQLGREIAWAVREWIEAGEAVEKPVEADERVVGYLRALLSEEGFDDERIDATFRKRRLELGALTAEYVVSQIKASEERLQRKNVDPAQVHARYAATLPRGQNGHQADSETAKADGEGSQSNQADAGLEGRSEPQSGKTAESTPEDAPKAQSRQSE